MEFKIENDRGHELIFHSRKVPDKNWIEFYSVTLVSPQMKGTVQVDNASYGQSPVELFQSMEREWKGWSGEKSWGSLEGEFSLSATSDNTGHIFLNTRIQSGHSPPTSSMELEFVVESGQLTTIEKKAASFFDTSNF